ncbi:MAG: domain S-box protein [Alphaproteobacteria bacterium]|nr:domain S-box protein [Alphaproteobacteria bacterium]
MTKAPQILIVDDNKPFRFLLAAFLEKARYETAEAGDGQEALNMIASEKPAAILLDLQMQPMGGFSFLEEFNALDLTIPVIMITGDD